MTSQQPHHWQSNSVHVDGHEIAVWDRGPLDAPVLVFIHGITADVSFWPAVLSPAFDAYRCLSVSLPGHAPSRVPSGFTAASVHPDLFARCVTTACKQFASDRPAHLVGWSTGGFTALTAAASEPKMFASVTSISGFARGHWHGLLGLMQWLSLSPLLRPLMRQDLRWASWNRHLFHVVLRQFFGRHVPRGWSQHPGVAAMFKAMGQHDAYILIELFRGLRQADISKELASLQIPAQVIGGTHDPIIVRSETEHIASQIPRGQLHLLQDAGHMFFVEQPDQVQRLLLDWITTGHQQQRGSTPAPK